MHKYIFENEVIIIELIPDIIRNNIPDTVCGCRHRWRHRHGQSKQKLWSSVQQASVRWYYSDRGTSLFSGVGKTSIILRRDGQGFSSRVSPTIGASFITSSVMTTVDSEQSSSTIVELQIWDTVWCIYLVYFYRIYRRVKNDFDRWYITDEIGHVVYF